MQLGVQSQAQTTCDLVSSLKPRPYLTPVILFGDLNTIPWFLLTQQSCNVTQKAQITMETVL